MLKKFKSLSWLLTCLKTRLDHKDYDNFEFYDVITWSTNNNNTHIGQFSRTKANHTMKLNSQLIEDCKKNIFLQKSCRKWGRETSFRPLFVFEIAFSEVKAFGLQLSFNIFWWPSTWYTNKINYKKLYIIDPEICSVLLF